MQVKMDFNVLNGEVFGFSVEERRLVVTPDESLTGETNPSKKKSPVESGRLCLKCKKGTLIMIKSSEDSPETEFRCTYCC